jgi:hypothetical protein
MARFGHVSKRGGVSALILATSAGLLMTQLAHSTTTATAAVATKTTVKVPATAVFGQSVALTAAVSPAPSTAGGVTFLDNGVAISPVRHSSTGRYSFSLSTLAMGAHSISAAFGGDPQNAPSASAPSTLTIAQAGTTAATMVLSANPQSPVQGGTVVNFTAQLTGVAGQPTPTGSVTFKNGAAIISAGRSLTAGAVSVPDSNFAMGANNISAAYSGDAVYAPQTANLVMTVTASPNDKFVMHLYTDMIGQQDASGQSYWVSQLIKGVPRAAVAYAFTQTPQYMGGVVSRLYTNVMARPVDANGSAYWIGRLRTGLPPEGLAASLVASDERYASPSFGNNTPDTFIHATYKAMLGRDAEPAGLAFWHDFLMTGGPRWKLSLDFAYSQEWATQTVTREYAQLNMGVPGADAVNFWVGQVLGGMSDATLASQLAGSQSYFDWAQSH